MQVTSPTGFSWSSTVYRRCSLLLLSRPSTSAAPGHTHPEPSAASKLAHGIAICTLTNQTEALEIVKHPNRLQLYNKSSSTAESRKAAPIRTLASDEGTAAAEGPAKDHARLQTETLQSPENGSRTASLAMRSGCARSPPHHRQKPTPTTGKFAFLCGEGAPLKVEAAVTHTRDCPTSAPG